MTLKGSFIINRYMQTFKQYLIENNMATYWKGFEKIIATRGWKIDPNGTDTFGNPVDKNTRVVVDKKTGKKRFRISRVIKGSTFVMDQTIVRDDDGNTIKGLGVLDLVYPYEKQFVLDSPKLNTIQVDPVNKAVLKKLEKYYGDFTKKKKGENILISLK
jgi:hypothetical protein